MGPGGRAQVVPERERRGRLLSSEGGCASSWHLLGLRSGAVHWPSWDAKSCEALGDGARPPEEAGAREEGVA